MSDQTEVLSHIRTLIEGHKREIKILYAELRVRLPTYLKTITIQELRDAGATVDPDISFPRGAGDRIRKQAFVSSKIEEICDTFRNQVIKYYEDTKQKLPKEMLEKKVDELDDDELAQLGVVNGKR